MATGSTVITQYKIQFLFNDDDLSKFLLEIKIVNNIGSPWPRINVLFSIDGQDLLERNIYGQNDIKLIITQTAENGEDLSPPSTFDLLYVESNLDLPPKFERNIEPRQEEQRRYTIFTFLTRPSVSLMSCFVNKLWEEPAVKTPIEIVKELLDEKGYLEFAKIQEEGKNEFKINQIIIPPMSIKSMIDYVNEKFGIYNGPLFRYCNYSGHFLMWDMNKMMNLKKESPCIVYHKFPSKFEDTEKFFEINMICNDGVNYCSGENMETIYHGNTNVGQYGYDNIYIYHPEKDLYQLIKKNTNEIVSKFGLYDTNTQMKFHEDMKSRKIYYIDSKGFDVETKYSEAILTNRVSTQLRDATQIRFRINRNININNCFKIGEVVKLELYAEHEKMQDTDYSGAYIYSISDLILTRLKKDQEISDNWNASCWITAFRTVQTRV